MAIATSTAIALAAGAAAGGAVAYSTAQQNKKASQPAAPYGDAYAEGIYADANTLPFRLQVNQAAQSGTIYTDPTTGQVYDFRGNFDANKFFSQNPQAKKEWDDERAKGELQGWSEIDFARAYTGGNDAALQPFYTGSAKYRNDADIQAQTDLMRAGNTVQEESVRSQLKSYLEMLPQFNDLNNQQQQKAIDQMLDASGKFTKNQFDQNLEYLPKFNELQLQSQKDAFAASLDAAKTGTFAAADWQKELLPQINALSLGEQQNTFRASLDANDLAAQRAAQSQVTTLPGLNNLALKLQSDAYTAGDATGRRVNPNLYGVRDEFASGLLEELKAGPNLTTAQQRKVQQRIRGAQAARNNILGDGAAFDEAIAESDYAQDLVNERRSAALGLINSRDLNPNFGSIPVVNPTQVLTPNFTTQTAVNPLMPNFSAQPVIQPQVPNIAATTTQMPSLSPAPIQQSNPLGLLNPNAGAQSTNYGLSAWNSLSNRIANLPNPWAQGIGAGAKTFTAFGGMG